MARPFFDYSRLSPAERIDLAMELWDSLPEDSIEPVLTESQRAELDVRLEEYRRNPAAGSPWAEVRERIEGRLRDNT